MHAPHHRRDRDTSSVALTNVRPLAHLYRDVMSATRAQLTWKTDYRSLAAEAVERVIHLPTLKELPLSEHVEARAAATNILDFLALRPARGTIASLLGEVGFPAFVAELVKGVLDAIVEASVQQTEAYAELLKQVSETVDEFLQEVDDDCLRELQGAVADAVLSGVYRCAISKS